MPNIEEIRLDQIILIKPLWEKLNEFHFRESVYFKDHYSTFTFEERIKDIAQRNACDVKISVIIEDGRKRGYCLSTVEGQNGEVDSLFIDDALRGRGLGRQIVDAHVAWMKAKGCKRIRLGVSYGNEAVLGFYHKAGFFERLTVMEYREPCNSN